MEGGEIICEDPKVGMSLELREQKEAWSPEIKEGSGGRRWSDRQGPILQKHQSEPLQIFTPKCDGETLEGSMLGSDMTQLWFFMFTQHFMEEEIDSDVVTE